MMIFVFTALVVSFLGIGSAIADGISGDVSSTAISNAETEINNEGLETAPQGMSGTSRAGSVCTLTLSNTMNSDPTNGYTVVGKQIQLAGGNTYSVSGTTTVYGLQALGDCTIILNGASITPSATGGAPIDLNGNAVTVTLVPGSTNMVNGNVPKTPGIRTTASILTIDGTGKLSATGGQLSAGIGGGQNELFGTIQMNNGIITAKGGTNGAGIGGGEKNKTGKIAISGGTIIGNGNNNGSAGIGGGYGGNSGTIEITGGTVTGTGAMYAAGIGGGNGGNSDTIKITGGTVSGNGGGQSAGIGGGASGNGGTITISNATVNAYSGAGGAGIGGGNAGYVNRITISGTANVTATAIESPYVDSGAGIGAGNNGQGGTVEITGGTVKTQGGTTGVGIGGGTSGGTAIITGGNVLSIDGTMAATKKMAKFFSDSSMTERVYQNTLTVSGLTSVEALASIQTTDDYSYNLSSAKTIDYPNASTEVVSVWLPSTLSDEAHLVKLANDQYYINTSTRPSVTTTGTLIKAYQLTVTPSINGTSEITTPTKTVDNYVAGGAPVSVTATPSSSYQFKNWSTDISLTDNTIPTISFSMPSSDSSLLPIFEGIPVSGVTLNKSTTQIFQGSTETLIGIVLPSDALEPSVSWNSSDISVATVDAFGVVTALTVGKTTITITTTDGGYFATCEVTVVPVPVTGMTLNKNTTVILENHSEALIAIIAPANATTKTVNWSSSDPSIASVDSTGMVTGIKAGSATITTITVDGGYTATCVVDVIQENYQVTFDMNGATIENFTDNVKYTDKISEPAPPIRRAFAFKGWYKDPAGTDPWDFATDTMPISNLILYAKWERTDWEVFFDANGGEVSGLPQDMITPIDQPLDISAYQPGGAKAPNYAQHGFLGWKDQNETIIGNQSYIPTDDVYLKADWIALADIITRKKENIVVYKDENTPQEVESVINVAAEYTDYLGISHTYPVLLDWNPAWLTEGGVNEIHLYLLDPTDGEKVYGNEVSYLYVLNRPYINAVREIWIFVGEWINPDDLFATGYGETPNFDEKRIDRGALDLVFNDDAVDVNTVGTYRASFTGGFKDYDLKQTDFNFPVIVHVRARQGLTREEQLQVDSSHFWVRVTEIYHSMKVGQIIDITPTNYMDGGSLRAENVPTGSDYDKLLNVEVGKFVYMNPDILNILQEEKNGQLNVNLEGRSWIFTSSTTESMGNNYPKGYYNLRMDLGQKEYITTLVGMDTPQMQLHFSMNRPWFATPTFVVTPNDLIKDRLSNGATPYLFHYNENTNELEFIGSMTEQSNGDLSISINGVYQDYVILTSLPASGNYRITENTNALDSKTYGAIANNLIDSGHVLPSGNGLSGISTTKYSQITGDFIDAEKKSSTKIILIIAGTTATIFTALSVTTIFWKKKKDLED